MFDEESATIFAFAKATYGLRLLVESNPACAVSYHQVTLSNVSLHRVGLFPLTSTSKKASAIVYPLRLLHLPCGCQYIRLGWRDRLTKQPQ